MVQPLGYNDGILLVSLLYSSIDLQFEWDSFSTCNRPIHMWLLTSYVCVIMFRLTHLLGMQSSSNRSGDFLLDLRQKNWLPRALAQFTWALALPFFVCWTLLGTRWLVSVARHTPQCVPTDMHMWFAVFWLALCYIWIIIHAALGIVAWLLERRLRRAEGDLREMESDDVLSRWGQVSRLQDYTSLAVGQSQGLTPAEINSLCGSAATYCATCEEGHQDTECSICLNDFDEGETVRRLSVCGHSFHKSCIDLWLLRRADCPLCKRKVTAENKTD